MIEITIFIALIAVALYAYAKMQNKRASKAEQQLDDANRQVQHSEQIKQREVKAREKNNDKQTAAIKRIRIRKYFGLRNKK